MSEKSRMHEALERFEFALKGLEAAVAHARDSAKRREATEAEKQVLLEDRSKLAYELDAMKSRARKLGNANDQASARLGAAIDNIKAILGSA